VIPDESISLSQLHCSPRQAQILALAATGLSDREIGQQLGLSTGTVRTHWKRFYETSGVHSRAAAVALWIERRQVGDPSTCWINPTGSSLHDWSV
jgi:DNA-binding NarL/FixJ family response regulator